MRTLQALEPEGWVDLGPVPRPGGGAPLDHVLVGPGGVVVVSSRPWAGRIEVTRGVVQQNGFWRERETADVASAAGSVTALLPPRHRSGTRALICVTQHELAPLVVAPGVHVVGIQALPQVLRGLPRRLSPGEITSVTALLRRVLLDGPAQEQLTTAQLAVPPTPRHTSGGVLAVFSPLAPFDADVLAPSPPPRTLRSVARAALDAATARRVPPRRGRPSAFARPALPGAGAPAWSASAPSVPRRSPADRALLVARMLLVVVAAVAVVVAGPSVLAGLRHGLDPSPVSGPAAPSAPVSPGAPDPGADGPSADDGAPAVPGVPGDPRRVGDAALTPAPATTGPESRPGAGLDGP